MDFSRYRPRWWTEIGVGSRHWIAETMERPERRIGIRVSVEVGIVVCG